MFPPHPIADPPRVTGDPFDSIIGSSRSALEIRRFGRLAAGVDAPVLLLGESGTGKGVLARAIHQASRRHARPFVAVNCAAVPEALFESEFFGHVRGAFTGAQYTHKGLFEQANTGTLFLDEIGELPATAQAKLLTVLEDRLVRRVGAEKTSQIDVRIIAATTLDVHAASADGHFRVDLLHRLSVLTFTLPALRARNGDLRILAEMFLREMADRHRRSCDMFSECAIAAIHAHTWPGNIRELANAIETAVLYCDDVAVTSRHLSISPLRAAATSPAYGGLRYSFHGSTVQESTQIREALSACRGNKTRAAALLGMSRSTLLNKLRLIETV
jgi:transcriptional regulator with PAS, ATPase and Fis domain